MKSLMFSCLTPSPLEDCFANLPVDKFNENDTQTIAPLQALGSEVSHVLEMLSDNKEMAFTRQSQKRDAFIVFMSSTTRRTIPFYP
jgi:hypothetical protein